VLPLFYLLCLLLITILPNTGERNFFSA